MYLFAYLFFMYMYMYIFMYVFIIMYSTTIQSKFGRLKSSGSHMQPQNLTLNKYDGMLQVNTMYKLSEKIRTGNYLQVALLHWQMLWLFNWSMCNTLIITHCTPVKIRQKCYNLQIWKFIHIIKIVYFPSCQISRCLELTANEIYYLLCTIIFPWLFVVFGWLVVTFVCTL